MFSRPRKANEVQISVYTVSRGVLELINFNESYLADFVQFFNNWIMDDIFIVKKRRRKGFASVL